MAPLQSWHCEDCILNWPYFGNYQDCGVCACRCVRSTNEPMEVTEAEELKTEARADREAALKRRRSHESFEQWYADREVGALMAELDEWMAAITPS